MRKVDKNGFIKIIEEYELSPLNFKKYEKEVDGNDAFILRLIKSPLFFMIRTDNNNIFGHDCRFISFAKNFPKSNYIPGYWVDIESIYAEFKFWIERNVKPYLEEKNVPDLWELIDGKNLLQIDPLNNREDIQFNNIEKEQIKASLEEFKKLIFTKFDPTNEQLYIINDRIQYLTERLDKVNKIDWQGIAISTVISISIALSLDTTQGKLLFNLFNQAFSSVILFLSK